MYMDDTTMYMDILPFDVNDPLKMDPNHPLGVESNKLLLPEPADPWLVNQAGMYDTQLPVTNTSNSSSPFGRLSPTLEQFADSLLPNEVSLPHIDGTFDLDVALDSFSTIQNDDILDVALESLELEPVNQQHPVTPQRRRSKRLSSKANTCMASYAESPTSAAFHSYPVQDVLTPVDHTSAWSSVGDADSNDASEGAKLQRKRRPKVSYSTLTEDQKYQRIRDLNNEASRQYRERMREQLTSLQERELKETERNRVLRIKAERLERLRDDIKAFTYNFFREHMGNAGVQ